jgi:ElaB/YqjD/DUF883 family membrane-anchored ribosome-binding protein
MRQYGRLPGELGGCSAVCHLPKFGQTKMNSSTASASMPQHSSNPLEETKILIDRVQALLSGDASAVSPDELADLQAKLKSSLANLEQAYDTTKEAVSSGLRKVDDSIRRHPYATLAVALGVGLLIGSYLRRR